MSSKRSRSKDHGSKKTTRDRHSNGRIQSDPLVETKLRSGDRVERSEQPKDRRKHHKSDEPVGPQASNITQTADSKRPNVVRGNDPAPSLKVCCQETYHQTKGLVEQVTQLRQSQLETLELLGQGLKRLQELGLYSIASNLKRQSSDDSNLQPDRPSPELLEPITQKLDQLVASIQHPELGLSYCAKTVHEISEQVSETRGRIDAVATDLEQRDRSVSDRREDDRSVSDRREDDRRKEPRSVPSLDHETLQSFRDQVVAAVTEVLDRSTVEPTGRTDLSIQDLIDENTQLRQEKAQLADEMAIVQRNNEKLHGYYELYIQLANSNDRRIGPTEET